jgi:hypothetical protein
VSIASWSAMLTEVWSVSKAPHAIAYRAAGPSPL